MRIGLVALLLGSGPAQAECTLFSQPTIEGVAIQASHCVNGPLPMDVTYDIRVQSGQTFVVTLAGKTVVVSTGPATCDGKPAVPAETDAHNPLDEIIQKAASCVARSGLDLDHPLVHVQLGHWKQTGPTESTLVRETRITVDFDTIQHKPSPVRIAVQLGPVWTCSPIVRP